MDAVPTEEQAVALLRKYAPDDDAFKLVLAHANKVKEVALRMARGKEVNLGLVKAGALLHDIGRFRCPPGSGRGWEHGAVGAKILLKEGHPALARIAERHVGTGISAKDIEDQGLDLPKKDYLPKTMEEKIVTYADKLVSGDKEISYPTAKRRWQQYGQEVAARLEKLKHEIEEC